MTPLLEALHIRSYGHPVRRTDNFLPAVELHVQRNDGVDSTFPVTDGYKMTLVARQLFWANSAQYEGAYQNAKHALVRFIYAAPLAQIYAIRNAIFSGDREEALALLDELEKEYRLL